jgi:hypothetical protein
LHIAVVHEDLKDAARRKGQIEVAHRAGGLTAVGIQAPGAWARYRVDVAVIVGVATRAVVAGAAADEESVLRSI